MEKCKPEISDAHVLDVEGLEDIFDDMYEVHCGKCGQTFGLSTGDRRDTSYFKENFLFCNKCGTPVDWN